MPRSIDITALCAKAHSQAQGDREKATDLLEEWARRRPPLAEAILGNALRERCWELIRGYQRHQLKPAPRLELQPAGVATVARTATASARPVQVYRERPNGKTAAGVRALGEAVLLYKPLPNGVVMADAKRADLAEAIDFHSRQARGNQASAAYYKAVHDTISAKQRVGDALTDDALQELWRAAEK